MECTAQLVRDKTGERVFHEYEQSGMTVSHSGCEDCKVTGGERYLRRNTQLVPAVNDFSVRLCTFFCVVLEDGLGGAPYQAEWRPENMCVLFREPGVVLALPSIVPLKRRPCRSAFMRS